MPASLNSVEFSRSFTFHVDASPRYGNFQNLNHLPSIGKGFCAGEHYVPFYTNQSVFKTISSWIKSWQPWQQSVLLCGIVDRLPIHQVDLLATSLEPLSHRDYTTACRQRYPSSPLKKTKSWDFLQCDGPGETLFSQTPPLNDSLGSEENRDCQPEGITEYTARKESEEDDINKACLSKTIEDDQVNKLDSDPTVKTEKDQKHESSHNFDQKIEEHIPSKTSANDDLITEKCYPVNENNNHNISIEVDSAPEDTVKCYSEVNTGCEIPNNSDCEAKESTGIENKVCSECNTDIDNRNFEANNCNTDLIIDQTIESSPQQPEERSVTVVESILHDVISYVLELCQDEDQEELSNLPRNEDEQYNSEQESKVLEKAQALLQYSVEATKCKTLAALSSPVQSLSVQCKGLKRNTRSQLDFRKDIDHVTVLKKISQSSPNIHSNPLLNSPYLKTPDFFGKNWTQKLGPLQRSQDVYDKQSEHEDAVPLNQMYKNAKWWSEEPPAGKLYIPALRKDLMNNYRNQLQEIWKLLDMWTDFERVAFVKEMIKSSTTEALTAFAKYVQQRLKETFDISRLIDKLLLRIFSGLSSKDIVACSQVCRRWRYLCALSSLWKIKCQQIVNEECLGNLNDLVMRVGGSPNGVDWRKAHGELLKIATHKKHNLLLTSLKASHGNSVQFKDEVKTDNITSLKETLQHSDDLKNKALNDKSEELKVKLGSESEIFRYKTEGYGSDNDSDISEDLVQLMTNYNYNSSSLRQKKSVQHKRTTRRHANYPTTNRQGLNAVPDGPQPLEPVDKTKGHSKKPEDIAYDIRPHLRPYKDILGKTEASHRLQWVATKKKSTPTQRELEIPLVGIVPPIKRVRKLEGHEGGVLCVDFDQRRLVSGGWDRIIRLWDVRSGRSLRRFYGHRGGVHSIVFDNDIMASGSWDMTVMIWCMKKFTRRLTLHDHRGCVSCLCLHPQYLITGSHDKTIHVYDRSTFLCNFVIRDHTGAITCLQFDGTCILSGSTDKTLRLTNVHTQQLVRVFEGMQDPVLSLVSRGSLLIAGDSLGRVYFWNMNSGETEAAVQAHDANVNSIGFWGNRLLTASGDCTIKEWDLNTMTVVRCLDGHKGPIRQIKISDKRLVTCSDDGNVRVWDTATISQQPKRFKKT